MRFFMNSESEALDVLHSIDLSMSQARCLMHLRCASAPMPISNIADSIHLSPAATGRVIDHLVGEKLLERKESGADRRIKLVELTERGRRMTDSYMDAKANRVSEVLIELTADQCETLIDALSPLLTNNPTRSTNDVN